MRKGARVCVRRGWARFSGRRRAGHGNSARRKKEGGLFLKWETVFLKAEPVGDNLTYLLRAINGKKGRKML